MASRTSTATTTRDLAFIITTSHATPDEQSRKLIRSHVMQGKNKGKTYRARRPGTSGQRSTRRTKPPAQQVESQKDSDPGVLTRPRADAIPKKVGSDLSFFQVADESIETPTLLNLFKFAPMAKQVMFLLEPHVSFHDGPRAASRAASQWALLPCSDAAYLNAVAYAHHFYRDLAAGRRAQDIRPPRAAHVHLARSLRLLRERLSSSSSDEDEDADADADAGARLRLSDSTLQAILTLAGHAVRLGQHGAAGDHLGGVRRIVDLRGGVARFRGNPKLLVEIFRTDIGLALDTGSPPIFFHDPTAEPFLPYLDKLAGFIPASHHHRAAAHAQQLGIRSAALARAWDTTRTFCALLNYAAAAGRKIPLETLLNTMASVMYRLLRMGPFSSLSTVGNNSCSRDEVLRLGLLAFCDHVFLQWAGIRPSRRRHLAAAYRDALLLLGLGDPDPHPLPPPEVSLWLLFTGRVALFSEEEEDGPWLGPWLRATLDLCGAATWDETRVIMKAFLWIDYAQDEIGAKTFRAIREGETA